MRDERIAMGEHPSKPQLSLSVGVTGHRALGDLANQDRIERTIAFVLEEVSAQASRVIERRADVFDDLPPKMTIISALASGADSLAARAAISTGYVLHALLPFSIAQYRNEFGFDELALFETLLAEAAVTIELDGEARTQESRSEAYLNCGRFTFKQSGLLIAVWDGGPARGVGGSAMIIEEAVREDSPVIWIHAEEDRKPCFLRDDLCPGASLEKLPDLIDRLVSPAIEQAAAEDQKRCARGAMKRLK